MTMGRCRNPSDGVNCTNRVESCKYPEDFTSVDERCTLKQDLLKNNNTQFPFCKKKIKKKQLGDKKKKDDDSTMITCVWSEEDCDRSDLGTFHAATVVDDEDYDSDFNYLRDGCDCSLVHTGGCIHDDATSFHCAISPAACSEETTFVDVRKLLHEYRYDCRLCQGSGNSYLTDGAKDAMTLGPICQV